MAPKVILPPSWGLRTSGQDGAVSSLRHLQRGWVPPRHTLGAQSLIPAPSSVERRSCLAKSSPDSGPAVLLPECPLPDPPGGVSTETILIRYPAQVSLRGAAYLLSSLSSTSLGLQGPQGWLLPAQGPAKVPWGQRDLKVKAFRSGHIVKSQRKV